LELLIYIYLVFLLVLIYSSAFLGSWHITSPQWSRFWYTEFMDVSSSLHDFTAHRPRTGRGSGFVKKSINLRIISTIFSI